MTPSNCPRKGRSAADLQKYLCIHGGVPVAVVKDDSVGARQVHPHAPRACTEDEDKDLRVAIEALHEYLYTQQPLPAGHYNDAHIQ